VRLDYNDVDDAILDPATARIEGGTLVLSGYVRWDGFCLDRERKVKRKTLVPLTLSVAPVTAFRFENLEAGTGALIAGELTITDGGAVITGVIPGDLIVESPAPPNAWFDSLALAEDAGKVLFIDAT